MVLSFTVPNKQQKLYLPNPKKELKITLERNNQPKDISVTPGEDAKIGVAIGQLCLWANHK